MSPQPSMYESVLGPSFELLHPVVRRFHRLRGLHALHGQVQCLAAAHWLGRALAWSLGAPRRPGAGPIRFELQAGPTQEQWVRHFPGCSMRSTLCLRGTEVVEHLRAATLVFALAHVQGRLVMQLRRMFFLGVPCPRALLPRITAQESGTDDGRFIFEVEARVPGLGRVVGYSGHLLMPAGETP